MCVCRVPRTLCSSTSPLVADGPAGRPFRRTAEGHTDNQFYISADVVIGRCVTTVDCAALPGACSTPTEPVA